MIIFCKSVVQFSLRYVFPVRAVNLHVQKRLFRFSPCSTACADAANSKVRKFKALRGTGDKGTSGLFSGERRFKDDAVFEALGSVDELTSVVGICRELCFQRGFFDLAERLLNIQCSLQDIASHVATPHTSATAAQLNRVNFDSSFSNELDMLIDQYANEIPELRQFILPGGGLLSANLHFARTIARRCERRCVGLAREDESLHSCTTYLNRLSDLLFVFARYACHKEGHSEVLYKKPPTPKKQVE